MGGILDALGGRAKLMEKVLDQLTPEMKANTKALQENTKALKALLQGLKKKE